MTISIRPWHDSASWNAFVATTPRAHFQQSWEWGELAPDLGGRVIRLAALDDDRMVGAAQIFISPVRYTGSEYLYVPRGPAVCSPSVAILAPLLDACRAAGREASALGIRVEPNAPACNPEWKETLHSLGLRPTFPPSQPRSSWLLDIRPDPDTLLAGMKQKTRYNVRLAERKGVEVSEGEPADLDTFYALYRETAQRDDFFIHSREMYGRMFSLFWEADNFCLLLARYRGEVIAAVTLIRFGRTCWYLQGASSNEHRNLMSTYLLQWEGIRRARDWGCDLYDFRAIPDVLDPDQDMYGVYRFKEGFGGYSLTTLNTYTVAYRPGLFGLWQLYFRARFDLDNRRRRRQGLPIRQFA